MSFYLSNSDTGPIGVEPAEFIDTPLIPESPLAARPPTSADDPGLSFFPHDRRPLPVAEVPVTIAPQLDGPLVIEGTVALTHPDGSTELVGRVLLCRCGGSSAKPRCDGTHARIGFRAPGLPS